MMTESSDLAVSSALAAVWEAWPKCEKCRADRGALESALSALARSLWDRASVAEIQGPRGNAESSEAPAQGIGASVGVWDHALTCLDEQLTCPARVQEKLLDDVGFTQAAISDTQAWPSPRPPCKGSSQIHPPWPHAARGPIYGIRRRAISWDLAKS